MRKASKNCSKRKGEKTSKTLTDINGEAEGGNKGFYARYLLISLSPRHKGHTYIGFTVNPKRRIRQHNGEITMGATRTKKKRPWEMILCIYGFPTHVAALQFEWAWQHPTESLAVRSAACSLKSLNGLPNKIKVAFTMLTLHTWKRCVDEHELQLMKHGSLKRLYFYHQHLTAVTKIGRDAVLYVESLIESIRGGLEGLINILDSDGGFGSLESQVYSSILCPFYYEVYEGLTKLFIKEFQFLY